jgi:DNA-binding transcriptional regulator YiaG
VVDSGECPTRSLYFQTLIQFQARSASLKVKIAVANIATLLKTEISRISRREIRAEVQPLRKASAAYRREIAALKREIHSLRRQTNLFAKRAAKPAEAVAAEDSAPRLRFVAKGLRSLRARLGLSAPELARLLGVSDQSVYNWELKKTVPRKEQLANLATIRSSGKREVQARLKAIDGRQKKKTAGKRPKARSGRG